MRKNAAKTLPAVFEFWFCGFFRKNREIIAFCTKTVLFNAVDITDLSAYNGT